MNLEKLVPRMIGGAVGGLVLSFISGWGLVGTGHGGVLEEMGLAPVGCAGVFLGPVLGAIVSVYFARTGSDNKTEEQAEIVWALWVVASALGWVAGWVVAILVDPFFFAVLAVTGSSGVIPALVGALAGATVGGLLGIAQGYILRRWALLEMDWWVLASAVGGAVGRFLVRITDVGISTTTFEGFHLGLEAGALAGAIFGALLGAAQWLVLRRQASQAGWWILASAIGWTVGLGVGSAVGGPGPFILPGALCGAITGAAMVWMLSGANQTGEQDHEQGN